MDMNMETKLGTGTPWGVIQDTIELPNGVTLAETPGGVLGYAPNNPPGGRHRKLIDSSGAVSWLYQSISGAYQRQAEKDAENGIKQAEEYRLEQFNKKAEKEAERQRKERFDRGLSVTMPDGTKAKLVPAE